mmetsp:Transcript_2190/g.8010  ORF Transcript_2190/g.8010 Transcript_2190/m.8010 type:complete len:111 (-) Transcript_2190:725-1057(-)
MNNSVVYWRRVSMMKRGEFWLGMRSWSTRQLRSNSARVENEQTEHIVFVGASIDGDGKFISEPMWEVSTTHSMLPLPHSEPPPKGIIPSSSSWKPKGDHDPSLIHSTFFL